MDEAKLHQFVGQMLCDLGGAASIALVRIGDALGLYKALHEWGPMTVRELAAAAGVHERYLREWLSHQAASNYLTYDPATQKFTLPPDQAMVFAVEDSPVYLIGAFDRGRDDRGRGEGRDGIPDGRRGAWGDQAGCMFCASARFFRPGYHNNLAELAAGARWRRGQVEAGRQGRRCRLRPRLVDRLDGQGVSQFPIRRLRLPSELDRGGAQAHAGNTACGERALRGRPAKDYPGRISTLSPFFDCLHDMGDPAGAAAHVRHR